MEGICATVTGVHTPTQRRPLTVRVVFNEAGEITLDEMSTDEAIAGLALLLYTFGAKFGEDDLLPCFDPDEMRRRNEARTQTKGVK